MPFFGGIPSTSIRVARSMNTQTEVQDGVTARTAGRLGVGARVVAAVGLAVVMVVGILVLGRVASDDVMAMVLTTVFFVLLAGLLGRLAWSRRELAAPLGMTYVVVAGTAGVLLGLPLIADDVVAEDVVRVDTGVDGSAGTLPSTGEDGDARPVETASGQFESRVHPGEGTAALIDLPDGSTVLTLTDFATDNGPDLLVYLVPADSPAGSDEGAIDLGALKGNKGNQQYAIPAGTDLEQEWRVVVWCRAFTVSFTEAPLA